jgi:thiosulfate/3-mercaptopyruvate sulfurtransferase
VFGAAMRRAGVTANRAVVLYDDFDGLSAARGWWLLTHHGHVDVRLLDGGWPAWRAAGLAIESGPVRPAPGTWTPLTPGRRPLLDAAGAAALARVGVLLDARAPERYRGEVEPVDPVAGHVPGARNAPRTTWVGEDGRFLPPAAIAARAAALGVEPAGPVAAYCGSGITAAHTVFALALGGVDAALYAGSWSDWVSDPDRPVVTGVEP